MAHPPIPPYEYRVHVSSVVIHKRWLDSLTVQRDDREPNPNLFARGLSSESFRFFSAVFLARVETGSCVGELLTRGNIEVLLKSCCYHCGDWNTTHASIHFSYPSAKSNIGPSHP